MKSEFKNKGTAQAKKTCYFCKKLGHFKNECIKYKCVKWKSKKKNLTKSQRLFLRMTTVFMLSLRNLKEHGAEREIKKKELVNC